MYGLGVGAAGGGGGPYYKYSLMGPIYYGLGLQGFRLSGLAFPGLGLRVEGLGSYIVLYWKIL